MTRAYASPLCSPALQRCGPLTAAGNNTNRTAQVDNGVTTTYCYDNADRLTSTTTPGYGTIAYDAHGNTTTLGVETLGYDGADRHVTSSVAGSDVRYKRDATDRIIERTATTPSTVTLREKTSNATPAAGATSLTLTKPAGLANNDVMIAHVTVAGGTGVTISAPSGWTVVRNSTNGTLVRTTTYRKVATASEPANWTWTFSSSRRAAGGIGAYIGVDTANPVDISDKANSAGSTTSHVAPAVTTTQAGTMLLSIFGLSNQTTVTPPSGSTERYDITSGASGVTAEMADATISPPGGTGTRTATAPASGQSSNHTIALRPKTSTSTQRFSFSASGDASDATLNTSNAVIERFMSLPGGVLLNMTIFGGVFSYPNIHGDVQAVANALGAKMGGTSVYDAFGNPLASTTIPNNFGGDWDYGWLGQHQKGLEHPLGLLPIMEMGARQYDPRLGRFLQVDPVEGGTPNDYTYVDDPINQFDLDGQWSCKKGISKKRCRKLTKAFKKNPFFGARRRGGGWNPISAVKAIVKTVGKPAVSAVKAGASAAKSAGKAAVAVGNDFSGCVSGQPCAIGNALDYAAVNGALLAGVIGGVQLAVASCNPVSAVGTCVAGVVAGAQITATSGAGLYYYNRAMFGGT